MDTALRHEYVGLAVCAAAAVAVLWPYGDWFFACLLAGPVGLIFYLALSAFRLAAIWTVGVLRHWISG